MRAMVIWGNSLAKLSQKAHFLWAVNPNNAKSTFCAKNIVEIEQLGRTLNNPGRLALNKNSGSFWLFFFVFFFFITFGHITFHDIVLSCIFLLWTCCNIKELNQYYSGLNKMRKSDRLTELSVISINWGETRGRSKAPFILFLFYLIRQTFLCQTKRNRSVKYWKLYRV